MSAHPRGARALHRTISVAAVAALCSAGLVTTAPSSSAAPAGRTTPTKAAPQKAQASGPGRYLVTFADEPAASYEGGVAGYARTMPEAGRKLEPFRSEVVKWRSHLAAVHDAALKQVGATKLVEYTVATNGVAVELTAAQARSLAATKGVVAMEKDALKTLDTTYSPEFLGISKSGGLWAQAGGQAKAGQGVIVGVVDSGIWPESPSFAGAQPKRNKAGQPVDAQGQRLDAAGNPLPWTGDCVQGEAFDSQDCNDKLIGARYYVAGFGKQNIAKEEYLSPRDGGGHGSHTASTAAGNRVEHVTIDGTDLGTASGMAPGARIAAYKVCWEAKPGASPGCFNSDSVAAIDDAVADGVDVLNYSVGGTTESGPLDVVEQAFRRATNVGIFVANSAGNSGPDASTLDHPSPWLTTVAASTFRTSQKVLVLGNKARYVGASITPGIAEAPLVTSQMVALAGADATAVAKCFTGALDPAKAAGKIVVCDRGTNDRIEKSFEVKRAGGVGMVLTNVSPNSLNSDFHPVPSIHVPVEARTPIRDYIALGGATASIETLAASDPVPPAVPAVADFSSRGPSTTTGGDILKPDLSAPGVDVLAAVAPPSNHGRSYDFYSGTSMSSPHIAGLGAVIKGLKPGWSPAAIKSSLMTTAKDHADGADPFAQGAGFVQPNLATNPGLVFDASPTDYRRYMVGLGVTFASPNDTLPPLDGTQLNSASLAIGQLAGREVVRRTVTNVGSASETYKVTEDVPGVDVTAPSFTIDPGTANAKAVDLTIARTDAPLGEWAKGYVTFTGSAGHVVRIPVAVKPVAVSAPAELTGTAAGGSKEFTVVSGFTGTLTPVVRGLVGVTPQAVTVAQGAFDSAAPAESAATKKFTVDVPAGTPLVRLDVDATSTDDLDLFVYGPDGKLADLSASAAGDEQVTLTDPKGGLYTAYVNGYDTSAGGGAFAWTPWIVPAAPVGNLTVTGGGPVTTGQSVSLTATWAGLDTTRRWLGYVGYTGAPDRTVVTIG